ncbi:putative E3 ubiquitin-protein ligase LUL4 [Glycine soja]
MSQLGLILQESLRTEREARTILGLLTEQMDGVGRGQRRRRTLKERLRFTGIGCCGATWVFRPIVRDEGGGAQAQQQPQETNAGQDPNHTGPEHVGPSQSSSGMNLAAALAAERQFREGEGTPLRVSLMRLLEETEGGDAAVEAVGNDWVCCVCMGRKKGAAFIPCGHTFCRVCSRELWLNRGTCPLCNRSILEILDIF